MTNDEPKFKITFDNGTREVLSRYVQTGKDSVEFQTFNESEWVMLSTAHHIPPEIIVQLCGSYSEFAVVKESTWRNLLKKYKK